MAHVGFKKLVKKLESKGKSAKNAGGIAAKVMHEKYKEKDIKAHQKSGTSMAKVKPKKGK